MVDYALASRKVALLCLVPDSGHVIPLIRLGRLLESVGAQVSLVCAEEVAHLAEGHLTDVRSFGSVRPLDYHRVLARITDSTETTRRIWLNRWFEEHYTEPVQEAVLRQLDAISDLLQQMSPALLVADDHLFGGAVRWLAERCHSPLVLNYSAGTNYRCLRRKPWLHRTRRQEQMISLAARVVPKLARAQEWLLTPGHRRARRRRLQYLDGQWRRLERELRRGDDEAPHIATGLIELENRYLKSQIDVHRELTPFPSTPPLQGVALSPALHEWLQEGGPAVYICFGTMAPQQLPFARSLVEAFITSGLRALWASPSPPVKLSRYSKADMRWEKWVPQVTLLQRSEVAGFVSHAGGGSVQEALWFGKPLICIPLTWDQPYNAWVAARLGFAKTLNKHNISKPELDSALRALAGGKLTAVAEKLGREMRDHSAQNCVVDFLESRAASWSANGQKYKSRYEGAPTNVQSP